MRGGAVNPVRLRYAKRGKVRWISHRDVARALERAFRITELPLAFTEGFSPRPKVSFGLALSRAHGDQFVEVQVVLPKVISEETKELLRKYSQMNTENPRVAMGLE